MKLTFIHDGPLFYDDRGVYYEYAYHELFERYSYLADEITFMMRTRQIYGDKVFTPVPPQVKVVSVPDFKKPELYFRNKPEAERIVSRQVMASDILVLRSQSSVAQLALKYIKKYDKPYIIEAVGCSWDSYWNHGLIGKLVAPGMFFKTRSAIRKAPYVCYVTESFLQKRYPARGKTLSCSNVVLDEISEDVLEKRLERLSSFDPEYSLVLGTAAALDTRYKGQEYVIRALKDMKDMGYNVRYRLAGGMNGRQDSCFLRELSEKLGVSELVSFEGSLDMEQMKAFYDSLDIYIQPSKQEGLPRSVIEAMSRGCPVTGTDIAGIPELIRPELLFRKGSPDEVIKGIRKVLSSDLKKEAADNFRKARKFRRRELTEKRQLFYDGFLEDMKNKEKL